MSANALELTILKKETSFPASKDQITWKDSGWPLLGHMPPPPRALDQSLWTKDWSTLIGQAWLTDSGLQLTAGRVLTWTAPSEPLGVGGDGLPQGKRELGRKKKNPTFSHYDNFRIFKRK